MSLGYQHVYTYINCKKVSDQQMEAVQLTPTHTSYRCDASDKKRKKKVSEEFQGRFLGGVKSRRESERDGAGRAVGGGGRGPARYTGLTIVLRGIFSGD